MVYPWYSSSFTTPHNIPGVALVKSPEAKPPLNNGDQREVEYKFCVLSKDARPLYDTVFSPQPDTNHSSDMADIDQVLSGFSARSQFDDPLPQELEPTPLKTQCDPLPDVARSSIRSESSQDTDTQDLDVTLDMRSFEELSAGGNEKASTEPEGCRAGKIDGEKKADPKPTVARRNNRVKTKKWGERLNDLKEFKSKHGHCHVSVNHGVDPDLIQWTKRQRYHFKLKTLGKQSPIVDAQINLLNQIGFVWDSHGQTWDDKLKLLEEFRLQHGHCRVPRDYDENPALSTWVKRQRRLYKAGQVCPTRVERLEKMGFLWDPRNLHHRVGKKSV